MRVLIVLAHPKPDSFNSALCVSLAEGVAEAGHVPDIADLYRENFNPALGAAELDTLGSGKPLSDVRDYQRRIAEANGLAFVFPIWWFGLPAILKGFVERVFQENFAFRFTGTGVVKGLLSLERALILNTTGAAASLYKLFGLGKPLEKTFDKWTLEVCGVRDVKHVIFHDVVSADPQTRARHLEEARRLGREFFNVRIG